MSENLMQIAARLAVGEDPDATARAVLRYLKVNDEASAVLLHIVRHWIAKEWRVTARGTERLFDPAQIRPGRGSKRNPGGPSFVPMAGAPAAPVALELTDDFLDSRFRVARNGAMVTWRIATKDHHLERIATLDLTIDGAVRTKEKHLAAVALLDATGAQNLGEVAKRKAAA